MHACEKDVGMGLYHYVDLCFHAYHPYLVAYFLACHPTSLYVFHFSLLLHLNTHV